MGKLKKSTELQSFNNSCPKETPHDNLKAETHQKALKINKIHFQLLKLLRFFGVLLCWISKKSLVLMAMKITNSKVQSR